MSCPTTIEEKCRKEWGDLIAKLNSENAELRKKLAKSEDNRYTLAHQIEDIIKDSGIKTGINSSLKDIKEEDFQEILPALKVELHKRLTQAYHFDLMLKAVHSNETVEGAWKKFMMTLRLCGFDKEEEK